MIIRKTQDRTKEKFKNKNQKQMWKPGINPDFHYLRSVFKPGCFIELQENKILILFSKKGGRTIKSGLFFLVDLEEVPKAETFKFVVIDKEIVSYFVISKETAMKCLTVVHC